MRRAFRSFLPGHRTRTGAADGSPSSQPCITSNSTFRSATVRAMGPTTPSRANGPTDAGKCPVAGMRPGVGLSPQIPLKCAGTRMEPPPSLPTPPAEHPLAMAAASPPLDPPGVRDKIPRIVGTSVKQIVSLPSHQEFGGIGGSQNDRPGVAQARDQRRIFFRGQPCPQLCPSLLAKTGYLDRTLDAQRYPVQRSELLLSHHCVLCQAGLRKGASSVHLYKRVQLRIQASRSAPDVRPPTPPETTSFRGFAGPWKPLAGRSVQPCTRHSREVRV